MRQRIGTKKVNRYRAMTGLDVIGGLVRGGTGHRVDLLLRDGSVVEFWPSVGQTKASDVRHTLKDTLGLFPELKAKAVQRLHTQGPWRMGKCSGCVVADSPVPEMSGSDCLEYYGGHLICESVTHYNARLIAESPTMFDLIRRLTQAVATGVNDDSLRNLSIEEMRIVVRDMELFLARYSGEVR